MQQFKLVDKTFSSLLESYYSKCTFKSCEYSVGTKCFWNKSYPYEFAEVADCLVVKYPSDGQTVFDFPVAKENADIQIALNFIDLWCTENEIKPCFSDVPEEMLCMLVKRYPHVKIDSSRSSEDYIYKITDLRDFPGKHYAGQRNHIHQFKKNYPNYKFRVLKKEDNLADFFSAYLKEYGKMDESGKEEFAIAKEMVLSSFDTKGLFAGCIEVNSKIIGVSVGEIIGSTIIIHIEKALYSYKGIYQVLASEFLKHFADQRVEFVNREEDDGEKGLRNSKLQYRPCSMAKKIVVRVYSELENVGRNPVIKTERLKISRITESDNANYFKLCTDDKNNKYWGYDYRSDLNEKLTDLYFLKVCMEDFKNRICLSFGIHLNKTLIGEVVAYNPDYKGCMEVGCRILPEFSGSGYGREALSAFSDWVLYALDCKKVVAKCFKENTKSFAMLSFFMTKKSEDLTYCYFEKTV